MFTLTPGYDKNAILVIKVDLDSEIMYFSTRIDKLTLGGIDFDGKVIGWDDGEGGKISSIEEGGDFTEGGGIGTVGNFSFELARYTEYTNGTTTFSNFFNDFYPATSKPLLTSKGVEVGLCWEGATSLSDVTWFWYGFIEDYNWNDATLYLGCTAYDELTSVELPYYSIQDAKDDGISYYTDAPDESYGQAVPIVYGDFSCLNLDYEEFGLAPTVRIGKGYSFKICSHICSEIFSSVNLYEYLDEPNTMMELSASSPTAINTRMGHSIDLIGESQKVNGIVKIIPRGHISGGTNYQNAIDKEGGTYATLAPGETIKFALGLQMSESTLGMFDGVLQHSIFNVLWDAAGGNVNYQVKYWHTEKGGYSSLVASGSSASTGQEVNYYFGQGNYNYGSNPQKRDDTAHWTAGELSVLEFHILNLGTSTGTMNLKHLFFELSDLTKYDVSLIKVKKTYIYGTGETRTYTAYEKRKEPTELVNETNIYSYVKGYIYDSWIDA